MTHYVQPEPRKCLKLRQTWRIVTNLKIDDQGNWTSDVVEAGIKEHREAVKLADRLDQNIIT